MYVCIYMYVVVLKEFKILKSLPNKRLNLNCIPSVNVQMVRHIKTNVLFIENPNAIKKILYQDAFEVCNAFGAGKKKNNNNNNNNNKKK